MEKAKEGRLEARGKYKREESDLRVHSIPLDSRVADVCKKDYLILSMLLKAKPGRLHLPHRHLGGGGGWEEVVVEQT